MDDNTTSQAPPVGAGGQIGQKRLCDYCGGVFVQRRKNQKFCCTAHRRAFEAIISRVARQLYPAIRAGIREILTARSPGNIPADDSRETGRSSGRASTMA